MRILKSLRDFVSGMLKSIEYAQIKRAEAARRYWGNKWY